jgi:hypothetical protein
VDVARVVKEEEEDAEQPLPAGDGDAE